MSPTELETNQAASHTPEPWYVQPSDYPGGLLLKPIPGQVVAQCDRVPEMVANARRIVAAVNACEGISTEALEQGAVGKLLEALQGCLFALDKNLDGYGPSKVQAIAAATAAVATAVGRAA